MKKKNGWFRSARYATYSLEGSFAIGLVIAIVYALFFGYSGGFEYQKIMARFASFFFLTNSFMILVVQIINFGEFCSLSISFGITRKATWAGMNWFNILWFLQSILIYAISMVTAGKENIFSQNSAILYFEVILLVAAIGMLFSIIRIKYDNKIGKILCGITLLIGMIFVQLAVIGSNLMRFNESKASDFVLNLMSGSFLRIAAGIILLIYLLVDYVYLQALKKYEVKA